jgi:serine/threonine-protein kinase
MGFVVNEVIGNYECLGIIEKPKVGISYKVRNLTTGEIESLRSLLATTSRDSESVERLLREIRIQTRLSHPNIVEFHDVFEIDGRLVMTTEFVEAPTIAELCRHVALPPRDATRAITQLLDGLEQAHALGIVHRGITAEHVTIARDGAVKREGSIWRSPLLITV